MDDRPLASRLTDGFASCVGTACLVAAPVAAQGLIPGMEASSASAFGLGAAALAALLFSARHQVSEFFTVAKTALSQPPQGMAINEALSDLHALDALGDKAIKEGMGCFLATGFVGAASASGLWLSLQANSSPANLDFSSGMALAALAPVLWLAPKGLALLSAGLVADRVRDRRLAQIFEAPLPADTAHGQPGPGAAVAGHPSAPRGRF